MFILCAVPRSDGPGIDDRLFDHCACRHLDVASLLNVTAAEIQRTSASNPYDAILQLRPGFFATRGATSFTSEPERAIVVIVDRRVIGGVAELRNIAVAITKSIRRLSAADVYQIVGISAPAGGIEVVLGR